ncbi:MAG: type II toxin-antitoxin system RelE/ParE family toxin [Pseudolabrys sp.]|nr:type II toxin-antitoxin system RelE/ParE family toxin [Pseudolabrys sp.]MDP2295813.1 type II toxin-antitoxin system RelE/ParE family toxin [Pseudolabrys sp.]
MQVLAYVEAFGGCPFQRWFADIDPQATAKITIALTRLEQGNFSNVKSVGAGVFEYRIDFGPGYRVYFGQDGKTLIILLGGGTKQRQQQDIAAAHEQWVDYKRRKKGTK